MFVRLFTLVGCCLCICILGTPACLTAQESLFSLEGLIVTASSTAQKAENVSANVTVLDGAKLRADGITSVADALRSEAGIHIVRNGSFGAVTSVFMRGGESDYVLVLLDDMQINQPGGAFDLA